jgi:hypothetical protein
MWLQRADSAFESAMHGQRLMEWYYLVFSMFLTTLMYNPCRAAYIHEWGQARIRGLVMGGCCFTVLMQGHDLMEEH